MKIKIFFSLFLGWLPFVLFSQSIPTDEADRAKMARQLSRSIPMELGKVEGSLPQINILIKKGEKVQARTMVEEALLQIAKIEAAQKTLALLDETVDDEILMTAEVAETKRYLTDRANKLRNAVGIYFTCDAKLFDKEYPFFLKELQGALSQLGVSYVDNVDEADWKITITATAREYNKIEFGSMANYFAYVDVQMSIDKMANNKRVYADAISEKGSHTHNYEKAASEAYTSIVPRVSTLIKEQIEK